MSDKPEHAQYGNGIGLYGVGTDRGISDPLIHNPVIVIHTLEAADELKARIDVASCCCHVAVVISGGAGLGNKLHS